MSNQVDTTRAEAKHYITELARNQHWWNLAWLFVNDGLERSADPTKFFFESNIYIWRLRYEQSIASWYDRQFEIGRESCEWLLARSDLLKDIQKVITKNLELHRGTT